MHLTYPPRAAQVLRWIDIRTPVDAARLFGLLGSASALLAALLLAILLMDTRLMGGELVWLKPLKFALSFAILFGTEHLVTCRLSRPWRHNLFLLAAGVASAAAFVFEMAYIMAQAARGEPSHFNETTPWHQAMYALMGTGASALMATIAVIGLAVLLDRQARLACPVRAGIWLGFLITVILTLWVAGELAGNGSRYIGTPTQDGARIPVLGWSLQVGDLRPAHFLALHAMQVLPLVGLAADRLRLGTRIVWGSGALYVAFTVFVFLQALSGLPLLTL